MRRLLPWLVAVAGLALLVTGVLLYATGGTGEEVYAASYAPLTGTSRTAYLHTGQEVTGAVCAAAGAVVLAAVGGWAVGRRTVRRGSQRP